MEYNSGRSFYHCSFKKSRHRNRSRGFMAKNCFDRKYDTIIEKEKNIERLNKLEQDTIYWKEKVTIISIIGNRNADGNGKT